MPVDWGFYEVTVSVIALAITILTALFSWFEKIKNKKELRYTRTNSVPLLTDRSSVDNIEVTVGGNSVHNPHLISFEFMNIGKNTVIPNDFFEPLTIWLGDETKVLSAVISGGNPPGINPKLDYDERSVIVHPLLMNGGDSFKIGIISDKPILSPKVTGRIAGVNDIKEVNPQSQIWRIYLMIFVIGLVTPLLLNLVFSRIESILSSSVSFFSVREFAVKHLNDVTGEEIRETISFRDHEALDNSQGTAPLQVQIELERNYRYQILERLSDTDILQHVQDKIVELYRLPVYDTEGKIQKSNCPLTLVIPAGTKAEIVVAWTERWAEGVVNEGIEGSGERLGTYMVFLGYIEPCTLVNQQFE